MRPRQHEAVALLEAEDDDFDAPLVDAAGRLAADEPIYGAAGDRLGRSEFARAIVTAVMSAPRHAGFTIGVTGAWGEGKSSVLNLVVQELERTDSAEVFEFNPWLFSGAEQLVEHFFDELTAQFAESGEHFDATYARSDVLDLLAAWVGVDLDESHTSEQRRAVVRRAAGLGRSRGTVRGRRMRLFACGSGSPRSRPAASPREAARARPAPREPALYPRWRVLRAGRRAG